MHNFRLKPKHVAVIAASIHGLFGALGGSWANPTVPQVVNGVASFQKPNVSTLNVTNSPGAIINWQGFSIGANEVTRFIQSSASSAVLNRVVGPDISSLQGQLLSNGRVFLINPAGIVIGPNAMIDTAGFVGSTLNMQDADFLAGKLKFQGDASSGAIVNQGWIRTGYGGQVVLVAPSIENSGLIHTPGGELILAAGKSLTIGSLQHEGVQFEVQAPTDSVVNVGKLLADGGVVGVFAGTLKHSGDIRANALVRDEGGNIVLKAANDIQIAAGSITSAGGKSGGNIVIESAAGHTRVAGEISAVGSAGNGGNISVLGNRVTATDGAVVDASGSAGGGQILLGGDYQGANPAIRNSTTTFVGASATLRADATDSGDGGRIIVWSDDKAQFYGSLSAQGGPQGGDGGFAEVSGKNNLIFAGGADLGAPKGGMGSLLLDPLDLYVFSGGGITPFIIDEATDFPGNVATVSPATLAAITGNVNLFASRYMRISAPVTLTTPGQSLTAGVGAYTAPVLPDPLALNAPGTNSNQLGPVTFSNVMQIGANITTAGGAVSLSAPQIQTFAASTIATAGGAINLSATGAIQTSSLTLDAGTGPITATTNAGSLQISGATSSGSLALTTTGGSIFAGALVSSGTATLAANNGSISIGNLTSGAATSLTSSTSISTGSISTNGGALTATANNGSFNAGSTIDTRPGQTGAGGGAVTIAAQDTYAYYGYGSVSTRGINAGNANVALTGESITTSGQAIDTTGSVTLTASHSDQYANASINVRINNAAAVTAIANNNDTFSNSGYSASVTIGSDTILNANNVSATTVSCYTYYGSCGGANITLSGNLGVNVGIVTATAPVNFASTSSSSGVSSTYADARYENKNSTVNISSSAGPILAMSASSLVTATDVTLSTIPSGNAATGGDIGSTALPLKASVARNFTLKSGGDFKVDLTGTGPNRLDIQLGVAPTGDTWSGSLSGSGSNGVTLAASATDSTVTVSNFSLSGFDQRVYTQSPNVSLYVPNGNLTLNAVSLPKGDNIGSYSPFYQSVGCGPNGPASCTYTNPFYPYGPATVTPVFESLNANLRASGNLQIDSYTRAGISTDRAQSTTFQSDNGSASLAVINGNRDSINVSARTGIALTGNMTTRGSVSLTNSVSGNIAVGDGSGDLLSADGGVTISNSGSGTGDVSIDSIVTTGGSGNVNITANGATAKVGAAIDSSALEISSSGNVSIAAKTIGNENFANPLDIAANSVSLTTSGADTGILGDIGFLGKPVIANTQNLTISAGANFNVDTGAAIPLKNLTVTAIPTGVGASGLAEIKSESQTYTFQSNGTNFTLGPWTTPSTQFNSGTLAFNATTGDITLGNMNLGATGALAVTALKGSITAGALDGKSIALIAESSTPYFAPVRDSVGVTTGNIGSSFRPDSLSITAGNYYRPGRVQTGDIEAGTINVVAYRGADSSTLTSLPTEAILVGNIGTTNRAGAVSLATQYSYWGDTKNIVAGNIKADSINLQSYYYAYSTNPTIATGNLDATTSIALSTKSAVSVGSVGTIDAPSVSITGTYYGSPAIVVGAIGSARPVKTLNISGSTVNLGAITGDPGQADSLQVSGSTVTLGGGVSAGAASNVTLYSGGGLLTLGGDVNAGSGSTVTLTSQGASGFPFSFTNIDAGATGTVTITSPNGIEQTGTTIGITAATVRLVAANSSIDRDTGTGRAALDLRGTTNLTVDAGTGAHVHLHGSTLTDLNITKRSGPDPDNLILDGRAAGQVFSITDTGSGNHLIEFTSVSPLNLTANFTASGATLTGGGIATNGGFATLSASGPIDASVAGIATLGGNLTLNSNGATASINTGAGIATLGGNVVISAAGAVGTGAIDTSAAGGAAGGSISINTSNASAGNIAVGGNLTTGTGTGAGSITLNANSGGNITVSGTPQIRSDTSVNAYTYNGDIGTSAAPLLITAPNASLEARAQPAATGSVGHVFAQLAGSSALDLTGYNGFNVSSNTAFSNLSVNTKGSGTGTPSGSTLNLSVTGGSQTYAFERPVTDLFGSTISNTFEIESVGGTTPPTNLTFRALDGDLLVRGPDTIGATNLTLTASTAGDIKLQGNSANPLALSNTTQQIGYNSNVRDILITGKVTLAAAGDQRLMANRDVLITSGSTSDAAINVQHSGSGNQYIHAGRNIAITADTGSVTIANSSGNQRIGNSYYYEYGGATDNVTLQAGNNSAFVLVESSGSGTQTVDAGGTITFKGGTGSAATVTVRNAGTGSQQIGESYYYYNDTTNTVTLEGGSGTGASVLVESAGQQWIIPAGTINVRGGTGDGASARIKSTSGNVQTIGECGANYYNCDYRYYYIDSTDALNVVAGAGLNAFAEIIATGPQRVYAGSSTSLTGSAASGGYAMITTAGSYQNLLALGNATLTAGTGHGANASIEYTGTGQQWLDYASALALAGGGTAGETTAVARISSTGSQSLDFGSLTLTGSAGPGASATIYADGTQNLNGGNVTLSGGAGTDAIARINTPMAQTLYIGSLSLSAGPSAGSYVKIDSGMNQYVSAGSITLTAGGAGQTVEPFVAVPNASAIIEGHSQTIYSGTMTLNGGAGASGSTSDAIIRNLSGSQSVTASSIALTGGHTQSTTGILHLGTGTQTVSGNSGITLRSDPNLPPAHVDSFVLIQNPAATLQTITANNGGVTLTNSGAGTVAVTSAGTQAVSARFVDVATSAGGFGNATLSATGNQRIHTTNENATRGLRVAALGGGTASIESGASQLLEITYPEMMQTTGLTGAMVVGDVNAAGVSRVKAVDQSVFAGAIVVQSGAAAGSISELKASGTQTVSTLAGGMSVLGGSGTDSLATIDPVTQNILVNGPIDVTGGIGPGTNADASIVSAGTQNILATNGGITLTGGLSTNSDALITAGAAQTIGAAGTIALQGGLGPGTNADAIISTTGLGAAGAQTITSFNGNITLTGGATADSQALISSSGFPQTVSAPNGGVVITQGSAPGATAGLFASTAPAAAAPAAVPIDPTAQVLSEQSTQSDVTSELIPSTEEDDEDLKRALICR